MKILEIDSSVCEAGSVSRQLTAEFIGVTDVEIINVPEQFMPDEVRLQSIKTARNKLLGVAATW